MPYYIGDVIKESKKLVMRTPEEFKKTGIDARIRTNVEGIDAKKGQVFLAGGESIPYDYLVMATGADTKLHLRTTGSASSWLGTER